MARRLTEKDRGVLVIDKLKTSQQCALVVEGPTISLAALARAKPAGQEKWLFLCIWHL